MFKASSILKCSALAALFFISSCDKNKGKDFYTIHKDVEGISPKDGDFVVVNAIIMTEKDSVLMSTYTAGRPQRIDVQKPAFTGGFMDALHYLSKGDSATVVEPTDSTFKGIEDKRPPFLPKGSKVKYVVKVLHVFTKDSLDKAHAKAEAEAKIAEKEEPAKIEAYLKKSGEAYTKTAEGYYILKTKTTNGAQAKAGNVVKVHYTGTLLDGKKFDSSVDRGEPIEFPLGAQQVIAGWDLGIAQLKVGEKAKFLFPSNLAYGGRPAGPDIKAFSPLIFEVELVEIVKK